MDFKNILKLGLPFLILGLGSCLVGLGLLCTSSIIASEAGFAQRQCDWIKGLMDDEEKAAALERSKERESSGYSSGGGGRPPPRPRPGYVEERFGNENPNPRPKLDKSCNSVRTVVFITSLGMLTAFMHLSTIIAIIFEMLLLWFAIHLIILNLSIFTFSIATVQLMYEGEGYDIAYYIFTLFSIILCLGCIFGGGFFLKKSKDKDAKVSPSLAPPPPPPEAGAEPQPPTKQGQEPKPTPV